MLTNRKQITLWGLVFLAVVVIVSATLFVAVPRKVSSHPSSQTQSAAPGSAATLTSTPSLTPTPQPPSPSVYTAMSNGDISMLANHGNLPQAFKHIPVSADNADNFLTDFQQAGNILYIHTPDTNTDNIFAINADTGAQLWSYRQGSECTVQGLSNLPYYSLVGNIYYVVTTDVVGTTNCGLADQSLIAIDSKTGKVLWQQPHTTFLGATANVAIIYSGGNVFVLNVNTGESKWAIPTSYISHFLITANVLYTNGPQVQAISLQDGSVLWQYQVGHETYPQVAIDNDLIMLDPSYNHTVVFMRIHAGKIVWTISGSYNGDNSIDSSLQLLGNQLVELSNNSRTPVISVLNKDTGAVESHYTPSHQQTGTACWDHNPNNSRAYFTPNEDVFGGSNTNAGNQAFSIEAVNVGTSSAPTWSQQFTGVMTICYALGNFVTISTYDHSFPDVTPQSGPSDSGPVYQASGPYYTYLLNAHDGSIIWKQATNTWTVSSIIDAR